MFKRIAISGMVAASGLVLAASLAFACVSVAAISSVSPSSGPKGTAVTMTFNGYNSMGSTLTNGTTRIYFGGESKGVLLATVPTANNFTVNFAVPAGFAPSSYVIEAVSTGRNSDTGQNSREVTRSIFNVTAGVGAATTAPAQAGGASVLNQGVPQQEVQTVIDDQAVTRPDTQKQRSAAAPTLQSNPVAPGQSISLASQGVGSAVGMVLVLMGIAALGLGVAGAAALTLGRSLQRQPEPQKQRI